jgi:hypothetical protein
METFIRFRIKKEKLNLLDADIQVLEGDHSFVTIVLPIDNNNKNSRNQIKEIIGGRAYYDWDVFYKYTDEEVAEARLFRVRIKKTVEPCGEECGTIYDDGPSCPICGAGRVQKGPLILSKLPSLGKVDVCKTIGGEIIVSKRFQKLVGKYSLQGMIFLPILVKGIPSPHAMQLAVKDSVIISHETRFGIDYFDSVNTPCSDERKINICGHEITMPKEIYVCPNQDLVGLNLLSELYINEESYLSQSFDLARTTQYVGVKRGMLRPEPLYVCTKEFYEMVKHEKIPGMDFEIAKIVKTK